MIKDAGSYHIPVLLQECIDGLSIRPDGVYVDVTFGGGGHSRAILSALGEKGHLYGFDQDSDAINNVPVDSRFTFVHSNFRYLKNWMRYHGVEQLDGLLADLGVASHHFDEAGRGFSFRQDGPLDMRMNRDNPKSAWEVVNLYDKARLKYIFSVYGEEKFAENIAKNICLRREKSPIDTTKQLVGIIDESIPYKFKQNGHPAKKVFQAIRIEVNEELDGLDKCLKDIVRGLKVGGRLAVITFHSLEDRIVKQAFKDLETDCICDKRLPVCVCGKKREIKQINKKPIEASESERKNNPRSASAKLRIIEKI